MIRYALILLLVATLLVSCTSKQQKVLYIFNWTDYIDDTLIQKFEKQNNCKVIYDTYNSNENMLTKLLTTKSSYDIVVPSGDHVVIMAQKGLLEPIDKTKLKNYKNLDPIIMEKALSFDPSNKHAIPYFWGLTGLVYHKKYVPERIIKDASWNILANPYFVDKQKITMLDDSREVIGAALITAGYNPNDISESALSTSEEILKTWDANVSQYDNDSYKNEIQDGTTWLAQSYNGDALQIIQSNAEVGFLLPKEGATMWIDSMIIPKYAEHKDLAYRFIDFLLEPENSKINAEYVQYATPNRAALSLLTAEVKNNPLIYPNQSYLAICTMIKNIGEDVLKVDRIWQQIRK